jgi:hypothetical protein
MTLSAEGILMDDLLLSPEGVLLLPEGLLVLLFEGANYLLNDSYEKQ